jgi:two-component system sensor histidine kinase UhpB
MAIPRQIEGWPARWLEARATTPARALAIGAGLALSVALLLVPLSFVQRYQWNLATGLLFVLAWCLPTRWWPWLAGGTIASRVAMGAVIGERSGYHGGFLAYWADPMQFVLGNLAEPFLVMTGAFLLQGWQVHPGVRVGMRTEGKVHLAALVSSLAVTLKDLAYVLNEGFVADVRLAVVVGPHPLRGEGAWALLGEFATMHVLGNMIGILLLTPLVLWLFSPRPLSPSSRVLGWALALMAPAMALFVVLSLQFPSSELAELLRRLLVAVIAAFTMWHGWRGAVVSMQMLTAAVALEVWLGLPMLTPILLQTYLVVTGTMMLLFGGSVDDYRQQAADLLHARRRELRLLAELQDAALRNLQLEEAERRRLARELHDEFGQNLAALQTHLKLAAPHLAGSGRPGMSDLLLELTRTMQRNISRVLGDLRPAGLEQLGLFGELDRGSIRRLVDDAGLALDVRLEGDARLLAELDATHSTAIYRMAQESMTNIVRHAGATRCLLRIRINRRNGALWVFLDIRDDGRGRIEHLSPGNGLTGMRDRVLALNGALHLRQLSPGLRLHLLVRQDGVPPQ